MDTLHRQGRPVSVSLPGLRWCRFLLKLLSLWSLVAQQQAHGSATAAEGFGGWTCDELTPNLCDLTVTKGRIPIRPDGLWVTYWKYSSRSSVSLSPVEESSPPLPPAPVIMVHGGPGMTHTYMLPLKQLACRPDSYGRTRDIYFYDQGGCGESMHPVSGSNSNDSNSNDSKVNTTKLVEDHPYLLDPQYYATIELPRIIEHLGLDDRGGYHIVANSWGTILAQYFVLNNTQATTKGLKSLTLSGPLSDGDLYIESQWSKTIGNNLGQLPPFLQNRIHALEDEEAYKSEEYKAINDFLTGHFTLRTQPAPDCFAAIWDGINHEVYVGLQGPSEFTFGGVLGGFNTTPGLHTLQVPVALTSGEFDTMRPPVVDAMYREIPLAEWTVLNHSGHVTMIDDAGRMNEVVHDFVRRVEEAEASSSSTFSPLPRLCGPKGCVPKSNRDDDRKINAEPAVDDKTAGGTESGYSIGAVLWVGIASFCLGTLVGHRQRDGIGTGRSAEYEAI